jgi:hypothetical protein
LCLATPLTARKHEFKPEKSAGIRRLKKVFPPTSMTDIRKNQDRFVAAFSRFSR